MKSERRGQSVPEKQMDNKFELNLIKSLEDKIGEERQKLIADYVYDTFDDDLPLSLSAFFFAEMLKIENDDVCKWYEIQAIGKWKAAEYVDMLIDILLQDDIQLGKTSLHLSASTALGRIGESSVEKLVEVWPQANSEARLSILDALGETRTETIVPFIMENIDSLNQKEFIFAVSALKKSGMDGIEKLQGIYANCEEAKRIIVLEMVISCKLEVVYEFLCSVIKQDPEIMKKTLLMNSRNVENFISEIKATNNEQGKALFRLLCEGEMLGE